MARIVGTSGNDRLRGTNGNDVIIGKGGNDFLIGRKGDDKLRGGGGKDDLRGGKGDDELKGNGGKDILSGDKGADFLKGGGGGDTFRFDFGDGSHDTFPGVPSGGFDDVIWRFQKGADLIDIPGAGADNVTNTELIYENPDAGPNHLTVSGSWVEFATGGNETYFFVLFNPATGTISGTDFVGT